MFFICVLVALVFIFLFFPRKIDSNDRRAYDILYYGIVTALEPIDFNYNKVELTVYIDLEDRIEKFIDIIKVEPELYPLGTCFIVKYYDGNIKAKRKVEFYELPPKVQEKLRDVYGIRKISEISENINESINEDIDI